MLAVFELSGFLSVASANVFRVFPEAGLYPAFHGFEDVLQYCFHELIFSLLIAAWYLLSLRNIDSFYYPLVFVI